MLLKLLSYLAPEDVCNAILSAESNFDLEHHRQSRSTALDRKESIGYWAAFPLKTVFDVQRWRNERVQVSQSAVDNPRGVQDTEMVEGQNRELYQTAVQDDGLDFAGGNERHIFIDQSARRQSTMDEQQETVPQEYGTSMNWESNVSSTSAQIHGGKALSGNGLGFSADFQENFVW